MDELKFFLAIAAFFVALFDIHFAEEAYNLKDYTAFFCLVFRSAMALTLSFFLFTLE